MFRRDQVTLQPPFRCLEVIVEETKCRFGLNCEQLLVHFSPLSHLTVGRIERFPGSVGKTRCSFPDCFLFGQI